MSDTTDDWVTPAEDWVTPNEGPAAPTSWLGRIRAGMADDAEAGSVLPFAGDASKGTLRPAWPNSARSLGRGFIDLLEGPTTGTVTPEATGLLFGMGLAGQYPFSGRMPFVTRSGAQAPAPAAPTGGIAGSPRPGALPPGSGPTAPAPPDIPVPTGRLPAPTVAEPVPTGVPIPEGLFTPSGGGRPTLAPEYGPSTGSVAQPRPPGTQPASAAPQAQTVTLQPSALDAAIANTDASVGIARPPLSTEGVPIPSNLRPISPLTPNYRSPTLPVVDADFNIVAPSGSPANAPLALAAPPASPGQTQTPPTAEPETGPASPAAPNVPAAGAAAPPAPAAPPPVAPATAPGQAAAVPGDAGGLPTSPEIAGAIGDLRGLLADPRPLAHIQAERDAENEAPPAPVGWLDGIDNLFGDPPAAPPPSPARPPLTPQGVADAAAQTAEPTPGQAAAGNYRMGHIRIGGLDISIGTPQGGARSGTAPDGTKWSVDMPVDYGYIRGTKGADGDHLDAYLGPHAHEAQQHPVFIIDQRDADTLAFDEHKIMLGFPTKEAAEAAYRAAFDDGKGKRRMGAVTQMPWGGFKLWLDNGNHSRPMQYRQPKPPREKGSRRPMSLLEFLASRGGLADDGDLRAMDAHRKFLPRYGRLIRATGGGMALDRAREAAEEAGYISSDDNAGTTIRDLLDAIASELRGHPVFSQHEAGDMLAAAQQRRQDEGEDRRTDAEDEIKRAAREAGVENLRQYEIDDAVQFMLDGLSPVDALHESLERHAERWLAEAAEIAHDAGHDIPPFDLEEAPNGPLPGTAAQDGGPDATDREADAWLVAADAAGRPAAGGGAGGAEQGQQRAEGQRPPDEGQPGLGRPDRDEGNDGRTSEGLTEKVDTLDGARDQGLLDGVAPLPGVRGRPEKKPAAQAEPGGMFSPAVKQTDLVGAISDQDRAMFGSLAAPNVAALGQAFAGEFEDGRKFNSIVQARQFAAGKLGGAVQPGTLAAKAVDEAVELGVVIRASKIAQGEGSPQEKFDKLLALYGQQPTLGTRTSDSIERQAYSTPAPLAFVASKLAGADAAPKVYEPTAGTGMLLIGTPNQAAIANEIDAERRTLLQAQGIHPSGRDATEAGIVADKSVDVVIANPPFGALKGEDGQTKRHNISFVQQGYTTGEIDHAIALRSLEGMKDDGSAVLILGGLNKLVTGEDARAAAYNGKAKREFFYTLYQRYGVVDHFTVPGDLYAKQGAAWPVDVIVIRGRRKSERPLPSVSAPRQISSWDELKGMLDASNPALAVPGAATRGVDSARPEPGASSGAADAGGSGGAADDAAPAPGASDRPAGVDAEPGGSAAGGSRAPRRGDASPGLLGGTEPVPVAPGGSGGAAAGQPGVSPTAGAGGRADEPGPMDAAPAAKGAGGDRGNQPDRVAGSADAGDKRPAVKRRENRDRSAETTATQSAYEPASQQRTVETLVPTNMRTAVHEALARQEKAVGPIDEFVAEKLGYPLADLGKYFSAEQVDAIGMAIRQIDRGSGFVIGDQTGVGKGRFVAGLIRYAERSGLTPIFVTEKPNLYADMARDLTAIGMPEMVDAIFATNSSLRLQLTDDPNGPKLRTPEGKAHEKAIDVAAGDHKLPEGKRVMFTTYSQMQTVKGKATQRMRLMTALSSNAFVILDEAHNAGGAGVNADPEGGGRANFVRAIVGKAKSVAYSSATWAKRPDVLDLYGAKTDMRFAVPELDKLAAAIAKGGVPMQQIVTAQLAEVGQYTRREKSFEGVKYALRPVETDREAYDQVADVLAKIFTISDRFVKPAVMEIAREIREDAKSINPDGATGGAGATSTGFGAVMHNLINQLLLASKAEATVERALAALKDGKKPVIALANTMGSFIAEYAEMVGAKPGDPLDLNFNTLLKRYLQRTLRYVEKEPFSAEKGTVRWLKPEHLGMEGEDLFHETEALIDSLDLDSFPVVPIDFIRAKLEEAGYKVGEVTGRTEAATYGADGKVSYRQRPGSELSPNGRQSAIRAFNGGDLDVMILNQSGATGLSLHASVDFKDQRQRVMLLAQAEANIDTHMQMLGRVHRTGQIITPEYEQLFANVPAENRPAAVLAKKMASLNASTTANRTSDFTSSETPDVMNVYGGMVIDQMLREDRDLDVALGEPEAGQDGEGVDYEALARKMTGRLPLLSLARQEAVWQEIIERYNRMIQAADEAGENVLEAKTFELDARTIAEHPMDDDSEAPAGMADNPFAAPAKLVEMDVLRLVKPPTAESIAKDTLSGLGMDVPKDVLAEATDADVAKMLGSIDVARASEQQVSEHRATIAKALATRMGGIGKQFSDPAKADHARAAAMATAGKLGDILADAQHGGLISLRASDDPGAEGMPVLVLGTKLRGDRALAPSSWDLIVVDLEGRRRAVPLSAFKISDDRAENGLVLEAAPEGMTVKGFLEALAEGAGEAREKRVIVTGNILKGYAALNGRGQIINFLDHENELRQGILMPRTFEIEGYLAARAPTLTTERAIEVLQAKGQPFVTSSNATFTISATDQGGFAMSVPQSRAKGGAFYLAPAIRNAIGKPFISRGGKMVAQVPADRMPDLIYAVAAVMKREGGAFASTHEAAKKYAATKKKPDGDARMAAGWDGVEAGPEQTFDPKAIAAAIRAVGPMIGPAGGRMRIAGSLHDPAFPNMDIGALAIGPLMMVAVGPRAPWNIHHEAVHVLRNLGVLSPREWATLEDAAQRQGWIGEFDILKRYAHLSADKQTEEAVAEKFGQWSQGKKLPTGGPILRAWNRAKTAVDRVRNALAGRGFQTADDVFKRIEGGEVGRRAPGSQAPRRGPQTLDQALQMAAFFDTFADVRSDVQAVIAEAARFALNPAPQGRMSTAQPVTFAAPEEPRTKIGRALDEAHHGFRDHHKDTKETLEAIRKAGRVVDEAGDPYLAEELFHHRVTKRMKDFLLHEQEPLLHLMAEKKVPLAEFELFLHARHAEERNKQNASTTPELPDAGSGMLTADAKAHLAGIPAARRRDLDILAGYVDGMTSGTRALWIKYELEEQATIRAMTDAYQHYVPLHRKEMTADGPEIGQGFSVRGAASRRAFGSEREVVDILSHIAIARERAIIRGEKNRVANALLQLARDHPNPGFWTIDNPPTKRFLDPSTGTVRTMVDPTYKGHENVIVARSLNNRGEMVEHALVFNKENPRALRMAMAYRNLDMDRVSSLWRAVLGVPTRLIAKLATQWNLEFGITNLQRDIQEALVNLGSSGIKDTKGLRTQILKDVPQAIAAIWMSTRREHRNMAASTATTAPAQRDWRDLWEEFQLVGGPTGFMDLFEDAEQRTKRFEADLRRLMAGKRKGAFRALGEWLTEYNESVENGTRLAVYKAAKDAGLSRQRAASVAKNITVNFNRKGAWTANVNLGWAFFNASVQGIERTLQNFKNPRYAAKIVGIGLALGVAQDMMLRAAGIDGGAVPDHVKERNWIIPTFVGQGYVTIAMPHGLMLLPNIGRTASELTLSGGDEAASKMGKMVVMAANAFNPLGSIEGGGLAVILPTVVDPVAAIATNMNWFGGTISNEPRSQSDVTPGFARGRQGASWLATEAARWINSVSGGTPDTKGIASPTPDQIEYLVKQYLAGVGNFGLKVYKTGASIVSGEAPELKNIPFVSRIVSVGNPVKTAASEYYKVRDRMLHHRARVNGMASRNEDVAAYVTSHPEARLTLKPGPRQSSPLEAVERQISKMRQQQRAIKAAGGDKEAAAAVDKAISDLMVEFTKQAKEAKKP